VIDIRQHDRWRAVAELYDRVLEDLQITASRHTDTGDPWFRDDVLKTVVATRAEGARTLSGARDAENVIRLAGLVPSFEKPEATNIPCLRLRGPEMTLQLPLTYSILSRLIEQALLIGADDPNFRPMRRRPEPPPYTDEGDD
jgi:hypothetical protein